MNDNFSFDQVTYIPSPLNNGECIPRIATLQTNEDGTTHRPSTASSSNNDNANLRPFRTDDFARILDYDAVPTSPPPDTLLGHLELQLDQDGDEHEHELTFPKRYCALRASYIFYFDREYVETHDGMDVLTAPPLGCIPLERTMVEFPPGGRRCFREHAGTKEARQGYEILIRHSLRQDATQDGSSGKKIRRAPAYLICESLGQREAWASAIRIRANLYRKPVELRATGEVVAGGSAAESRGSAITSSVTGLGGGGVGGQISVLAGLMHENEQRDVERVLTEFGNLTSFNETNYVNTLFETQYEYESPVQTSQLEQWQESIRKGLRGAVLEQYEYFVEASREMTVMGREIMALREFVGKQVDTIETLKTVDFDLSFWDAVAWNGNEEGLLGQDTGIFPEDEVESSSDEESNSDARRTGFGEEDDISSGKNKILGRQRGSSRVSVPTGITKYSTTSTSDGGDSSHSNGQISSWLEDVPEEISAFIKECRYNDATELALRAKVELTELLIQDEKLTVKKFPKKQLASMKRILISVESLEERLCTRLVEGLRRKNEALKQAGKRNRADPLEALAPLVSTVALNDDATALKLLVKLGRFQDAATAYATRRSLLLTECLYERPICDTTSINNKDIVIYAGQLSHSFFKCLASSMEGFIDLFLNVDKEMGREDDQSELSSINTGSVIVPASALSATCLWCDSELSKFSSVFGSKVLGNLSLHASSDSFNNGITDKINKFETVADISHLKDQLRKAEEMGEYAAAGKLRRKIATQEQEDKEGEMSAQKVSRPKSASDKDRKVSHFSFHLSIKLF